MLIRRKGIKPIIMQMLQGKTAAVFAASGEIAGAVARSLAQQDAKVYVSARNQEAVNKLAADIIQNGGQAIAARVDALHENEIDQHLQQIVHENGRLDIVFNGIGMNQVDMNTGKLAADISLEQFLQPMAVICGSQFLTARTAAKYMIETRSEGTILMFTAALSRLKAPFTAAITTACTAIEGLTRVLAAELGQHQIKVICLNAGAILETKRIKTNNTIKAKTLGAPVKEMEAQLIQGHLLKKGPSLQQIGHLAAILASDAGITFNSHIVDADCGRFDII
jgi:NAD(P)-dependent dehydrogenase (short-subunit alcohol dehydrogenase family)